MNETIIQAWIYRIVILSNSKFVELRKQYKIKARKCFLILPNITTLGINL